MKDGADKGVHLPLFRNPKADNGQIRVIPARGETRNTRFAWVPLSGLRRIRKDLAWRIAVRNFRRTKGSVSFLGGQASCTFLQLAPASYR